MAEALPNLINDYLDTGTLLPMVRERCARALAEGALEPLATSTRIVPGRDFDFVVRVLSSLRRKPSERQSVSLGNPFLPHDPQLFVTNLSDTHHALLNKFNVLDLHVLIVTRAFEHQHCLLTPADFDALATFLIEYEGLGFYNGGAEAGASQPHKHLQYVTLPLAAVGDPVPVERALFQSPDRSTIDRSDRLPFEHRFARLHLGDYRDNGALAAALLSMYGEMTRALQIDAGEGDQARPYNLLVTRRWMMILPRRRERVHGISINALGFAGTLLVSDETQLEALLKSGGPMAALRAVSFPSARRA